MRNWKSSRLRAFHCVFDHVSFNEELKVDIALDLLNENQVSFNEELKVRTEKLGTEKFKGIL